MQSSKPSKKTSKTSESAAPVVTEKAAKPRATKSSSTSKSKALNTGSENIAHKPAATPIPAAATHSDTPKSIAPEPSLHHDEIAKLAYSIWAARGYQNGSPEEDWLRAERQLKTLAAAK